MLLFHTEAKKWGLRDSSNRQDLDVEGVKWKGEKRKTFQNSWGIHSSFLVTNLLETFSNCLSHQNHFNEHDMYNRSSRIIIIFLQLFGYGKFPFYFFSGFSDQATTEKRGFSSFSTNRIWIKISSSLELLQTCDNLWNINVGRKVPCVHNEIIKMSPDTFSMRPSLVTPPQSFFFFCFVFFVLLVDLFLKIHCEKLIKRFSC